MAEDIQRKIRSIISEIEEKSADGDYIYRGEHEWYEQVSSSLWRQFQCRSTLLPMIELTLITTRSKRHI